MTERLLHFAAAPFQAARHLPNLPAGHRAGRRHGHGFQARVMTLLPPDWATFAGAETDQLAATLTAAIAALDYQDLNTLLPVPGDAELAQWLRARLRAMGLPGVVGIGVASTGDQGVDLLTGAGNAGNADRQPAGSQPAQDADRLSVWRRFRFEAAHRLPRVPDGHPCGRMHGHGFEVMLHAAEPVAVPTQGRDALPAYDQLAALIAPALAELDHACLNDLPGLENPTSELIAHWLWQRLKPDLPALTWVTVYETATAGCHHDGRHYRIWKDQRFESALRLAAAPTGDPRRRLHGHSYRLRLQLTAPLDQVLGWTIDYGDVKALFAPVYAQLDHHRLDRLPGLSDPNPARLLTWIRDTVADRLPALDRIDLEQTPGCGAMLCWGDRDAALLL